MEQATLPDFLGFLATQSVEDFKGTAVDEYLSRYRVEQEDFLPFIYFREETYARNLVFRSEIFELLVITWLPHQRTPIHDHAGQRCWMLLQSGVLNFKNYVPMDEQPESGLVVKGPLETHQAGEAVYIDDGIGIHSICNATTRPAVSVHLYAAPITRCQIYNERSKRFEWKQLQYFTRPEWMEEAVLSPESAH